MVRVERRSVGKLSKIYREGYDFSLGFHEDVSGRELFFNLEEFASIHEVDGVKVEGVLTGQSRVEGIREEFEGISHDRLVLYARREALREPMVDMITRIDGKRYQVTGARLIQGEVWRVELGVVTG